MEDAREGFSVLDDEQTDDQSDGSSNTSVLLDDVFASVTRPSETPPKNPKKYLFAIVVASALGSFLWGYHASVIAGAMLFVDEHFKLNVFWHEIVVSVAIAGGTVGTIIAGMMSDKFGRWKMMMSSATLFGVGSIILGLSFFKSFLVVGRAIVGFANGEYF